MPVRGIPLDHRLVGVERLRPVRPLEARELGRRQIVAQLLEARPQPQVPLRLHALRGVVLEVVRVHNF